ncbi:MAG: OmpH family outer membrane protein [Planctomycetota bacterium]|nr:OmpH family outer membrane protein [Planctomycetota bacterium]
MLLRHSLALSFAASLFFTVAAVHAQDGSARIGICNAAKVLKAMDEWKAFDDKMRNEGDKIKLEQVRRKAEVDELIKQRQELRPDSAAYKEKSKTVLEKSLEYDVWLQLMNLERARTQKEQLRTLFDKIIDATKEVAETRKLDLVIAEVRPELPEQLDQITPDNVLGALLQRNVLYSNDKVDVTQAVILAVNKKYAGGPATRPASPK